MLLFLQVNCPNRFYPLKNISLCLLAINRVEREMSWVPALCSLIREPHPAFSLLPKEEHLGSVKCISAQAWWSEAVDQPGLVLSQTAQKPHIQPGYLQHREGLPGLFITLLWCFQYSVVTNFCELSSLKWHKSDSCSGSVMGLSVTWHQLVHAFCWRL